MSFAIFMAVVMLLVGAITPLALGWTGRGTLATAGARGPAAGRTDQRRSELLAVGGLAALTFAAFVGAMALTY